MFGNQFISVIEPDTKLGKGMVLHKDYLLGGSYHGNDSIFLLKCYGVWWQVEVKCLFMNTMSLVGPIWADFVMHNVTNDVTMLHFVEEGKDIFYVSTYNKYELETHGMMDELAINSDQFFLFTLVWCRGELGEALTACENYATYVLQNASCHGTLRVISEKNQAESTYQKSLATGTNSAAILQRLMESYALKFADDLLLCIVASAVFWYGL
ncbi:hypothetical protein Tco_1319909 [Tanacetum coccineum]